MKKDRLSQLFDFQKFEQNGALAFAISSVQNYVNSLSKVQELADDDLENVNAAGNYTDRRTPEKKD